MAQGIVIAGTHSGCGKTTVTLGLLAALQKKGWKVQSFKTGPDFIDAGLHKIITGRPSRNLDLWMCNEDYVRNCFLGNSLDTDISIIEGVMGMYDGDFSTARLSSFLELPVILVVDAYGMAESAGAVVKGFMEYRAIEQQTRSRRLSGSRAVEKESSALLRCCTAALVSGVIFNRVASDRHYERLKNSVNGVAVLGYLPRDLDFEIPHRHLGLAVAEENPITEENINGLADAVLKYINVEEIVRKAGKTELPVFVPSDLPISRVPEHLPLASALKVAVAYDKAFCFYYEDNLDMLRELGAEIIKFSPISDLGIPEKADCVYIGGGYPELYAKELSENRSMLKSVNDWANAGRPIYAECGGLMYLSQGIYDFDRNFHKMASALPFETQMKKGRSRLGYREIALKEDCILGKRDSILRGHEFHYSEIIQSPGKGTVPDLPTVGALSTDGVPLYRAGVESGLSPSSAIYSVRDSSGKQIQDEGHTFKNILASYVHIHFGSNPDIADNFVRFIKEI